MIIAVNTIYAIAYRSTLFLPKWINAMHLHLFSLNSFWGGKVRRSNIQTILIREGRASNLQQHYLLNNTLIHSPLSCLYYPCGSMSLLPLCDVIRQPCRVKRSFKPYQKDQDWAQDTGEKGKKPCNIDLKISMKILFHYPPTVPFI